MSSTTFEQFKTPINADWLNDVNTLTYGVQQPTGASLVGYLPAGTGAVATTVQSKLRESVSVKDFGAVCDGVTPDLTKFNTAITDANTKSETTEFNLIGYKYRLENTLAINPIRNSFVGSGAVLDFSQDAVATAINVRASTAELPFYNYTRKFSGFVVKGATGTAWVSSVCVNIVD